MGTVLEGLALLAFGVVLWFGTELAMRLAKAYPWNPRRPWRGFVGPLWVGWLIRAAYAFVLVQWVIEVARR